MDFWRLALLLLFFLCGCFAKFYEIEGSAKFIDPSVISKVHSNLDLHLHQEKLVHNELSATLGKLSSFFVDQFEIHGEDLNRPTTTFRGFFESTHRRGELIEKFAISSRIQLFVLAEKASLPKRREYVLATPVTQCFNDAFLLPNATCVCQPFNSGSQCENINCLHHGINEGKGCACPPGVYAANCEPRTCMRQVQQNVDKSTQSFILVVNQKLSMAYVLNTLFTTLDTALRNITVTNPTLIENYILVHYLDSGANGVYLKQKYFTTSVDLLNYLNSLVYITSGADVQPTNYAVKMAQSFAPMMRAFSNIFVFVDSLDVATPLNNTFASGNADMELILKTLAWRNRIVYFISQSPSRPIDTSVNGFDVFRRVATATLGDVIIYDNTEINTIISMMPYYQQNEVVGAVYYSSGSKQEQIYLKWDNATQPAFLILTVEPGDVVPTVSEIGKTITVLLEGARFQLLDVTGIDKITVRKGSKTWTARVFIHSKMSAVISYSYSMETDVGAAEGTSGVYNDISGAILGLPDIEFTSMTLQYGNIATGVWEPAALEGTHNPQCSYNYKFLATGKCVPGPSLQRLQFKVDKNHLLTRIAPGFCGILDHTELAEFTCYNGGTVKVQNQICTCTKYFTGKNCGDPVCFNGGTPEPFPGNGRPMCRCAKGFQGDHCDILSCTSKSSRNLDVSKRSLALLVQNSMSQAYLKQSIVDGASSMVQSLENTTEQFTQFILTTFHTELQNGNQLVSSLNVSTFSSSQEFLSAVNNLVYLASPSSAGIDFFNALATTMNEALFARSLYMVFTDSEPYNFIVDDVVQTVIMYSHDLTFVISPKFNEKDLCISENQMSLYDEVIQKTRGLQLNLCNTISGNYNSTPVVELFNGLTPTQHTAVITETTFASWADVNPVTFQVNDPGADLYAIVNSVTTESFSVTLKDFDSLYEEDVPLTSIVDMPFLGVYKISTSPSNMGYSITPSADLGTSNRSVYVRVVTKSEIVPFVSFVAYPDYDEVSGVLPYAQSLSPVLHLFNPSTSGNQSTVESTVQLSVVYSDGGFLYYKDTAFFRNDTCLFENYFDAQLACSAPGQPFYITITANAENGAKIQRTARNYCYLARDCANGYSKINGTCQCDPRFYTGDLCQTPVCHNGATADQNYKCDCGPDFAGFRCENAVCSKWNYMESEDPRERDFRQITFAVDRSASNQPVMDGIASIIQKIVDETENSAHSIMYTLITFDDTNVYDVVSTSHAPQFVTSFVAAMNVTSEDYRGYTRSIDAINEAYRLTLKVPSIIYLLTGTAPITPQVAFDMDDFMTQREYTEVNVIFATLDNQVLDNYEINPLLQSAKQSGGRLLQISPSSVSELDKLISSSMIESAMILDDAAQNCTSPVSFEFDLEPVNQFELTLTGNMNFSQVTVRGVQLNGTIVFSDVKTLVVVFDKNNTKQALKGKVSVKMSTTHGSCYIQARAHANIKVVPGFTSVGNSDFPKNLPYTVVGGVYKTETYVVYRLVDNNNEDDMNALNTLEVYSANYLEPWKAGNLLQNMTIFQRDLNNCAYQYVTSQWKVPNYQMQKFILRGSSDFGDNWQRTYYYSYPKSVMCSTNRGKPNEYGECQCLSNFQGDSCTQPICHNGGTTSYNICVCQNGYYGAFCDSVTTH